MTGTASTEYREQNKLQHGWDPVTSCDILTQYYITKKLQKVLPSELKICGEENEKGTFWMEIVEQQRDSLNDMETNPRFDLFDELHTMLPTALQYLDIENTIIWIDPLDGTREFVKGYYKAVTILVGISYFNRAIAGIIFSPYQDNPIICGGYGIGVFTNVPIIPPTSKDSFLRIVLIFIKDLISTDTTDILLKDIIKDNIINSIEFLNNLMISNSFNIYFDKYIIACNIIQKKLFPLIYKDFNTYNRKTIDKTIFLTSLSRRSKMFEVYLKKCKYDNIIFAGGAGHKAILILVGCANVYTFPLPGTKKWDTCAIQSILETHGACFTDILGNPIQYSIKETHTNSYGLLVTINSTSDRPVIDKDLFCKIFEKLQ